MELQDLSDHVDRMRAQGGDDSLVEVKSFVVPEGQGKSRKAARSLWESVSAFANTDGGIIILGLSEKDGFTASEGFDSEYVLKQVHEGLNSSDSSNQKVTPVPRYSAESVEFEGSRVVVLDIHRLEENGPCFVAAVGVKDGSFKRVGDADRKLNQLEIYELQHKFDQFNIDVEPVDGTGVDDLDVDLVASVKGHLRSTQSRVVDDSDQWLTRKNILAKNGEVTLAGLLVLGVYPQQYFPRLFIDVAVHPGARKSDPDAPERFVDRRICEGNLLEVVQDAMATVKKNLRVRRVVSGAGGHDQLEIPEEVLREAISNAVMHRDYSQLASQEAVNVDVYTDRVEVTSPGGLPGNKSLESLTDGRPVARNKILARLMMDVPWPGREGGVLAESNGSGIPMMFAAMRKVGLPVPEYDIDVARVTVTLGRFGLMEPQINEWLRRVLGEDYAPAEGIALVIAQEMGAISPQNLRMQTGQDADDMRKVLEALATRGVLVEDGPDRFRLPDESDSLSSVDREIISLLSYENPMSVRELSEASGRKVASLRIRLRSLLDQGLIEATAPPSSRNRAYLLARSTGN